MKAWLSQEESLFTKGINPNLNNNESNKSFLFDDDEITSGYIGEAAKAEPLRAEKKSSSVHRITMNTHDDEEENSNNNNRGNENTSPGNENHHGPDEEDNGPSGSTKTPPCAQYGRNYCTFKEDYPIKVVTEVTKYFKWPLEKLFRDLRHQVMPSLASDNHGGLVCDSVTRIIRPGWTRNTNGRWLVVINTEYYQQYITEVICRHGSGSYCNFIPPCYQASCKQRYNTQKLLVIDPWNPYKGPFLSEFLFPSCCVCFVPANNAPSAHSYSSATNLKDKSSTSTPTL